MKISRQLAWGLLGIGLVAVAQAQTTGDVTGRISEPSGSPVPGVTVTAAGPALQGARTAVSDADGHYRLTLLPPGEYGLDFVLEGLSPEKRQVTVALAKTTTLDVQMHITAVEEITVTADAAAIDPTSAALGANLSTRAIEALPSGRNYSSVVQVVPGVSSDANPENTEQGTITVYGSTGAENSYFIDGVNTTAVEYGFQGKNLNYEFIQEIDVKTGGYEAEFGRSTGGIINVITKSGGNEFRGDVFGYYDSDSLQSSADDVVGSAGTVEGFTKEDYGADLGGYIVKDRLWFFVAYDKVSHTVDTGLASGPLAGQRTTSESDRDLGSAKLTWALSPNHSLIGTFFQDPRDDSGAINDNNHSLNGLPSTYLGVREFGGQDYALRYEGILNSSWVLSAQAARHEEQNSVGPSTAAGAGVQVRLAELDFFQTGGFGLIQDKSFERDFFGASLARFAGSHEIKAGLEYEQEQAEVVKFYSGGQQVDVFANEANPARPIYSHFYWTTVDATIANAPVSRLVASPEHKNTTAYLQDRWSVRPNMTLSLGVRWDRQEIIDANGVKQIDLKDDYAPRLGFTWDPGNDRTSKLYGSYGRYYEQIPMDLVIRSFSYERQARIFNFSPTATAPDAQAEADHGQDSSIFGGFTEPSDPNLENQYINEYLVGYEREVAPAWTVGARFIYRDFGQVIEDFLCADDGTYCIGNPGEGIMREVFTLDYAQTFPAPKPKRVFKGVQLDATRRLANNWQATASYLYSKLDGNFDGLYAPFTNVGADPNITAAYDYYDFFTNGSDLSKITNTGPLSNDRRHQLKVSGVYYTPFKLSVGFAAYYRTGTPVTRYGYSDIYGRYEFFLSKRGAEGRTPDTYEADLNFAYPLDLGRVKLNFMLGAFNILNAQRAVLIDQRWGFQESDNASPTPANPGYGKPVLRTPPTSLRLGVRLSF